MLKLIDRANYQVCKTPTIMDLSLLCMCVCVCLVWQHFSTCGNQAVDDSREKPSSLPLPPSPPPALGKQLVLVALKKEFPSSTDDCFVAQIVGSLSLSFCLFCDLV